MLWHRGACVHAPGLRVSRRWRDGRGEVGGRAADEGLRPPRGARRAPRSTSQRRRWQGHLRQVCGSAVVSVGSAGTFRFAVRVPGVTEVRSGRTCSTNAVRSPRGRRRSTVARRPSDRRRPPSPSLDRLSRAGSRRRRRSARRSGRRTDRTRGRRRRVQSRRGRPTGASGRVQRPRPTGARHRSPPAHPL